MNGKYKTDQIQTANESFLALKESYPKAKDFKSELWELLIAAMGSDHADMWDKNERAKKMFLIELLGTLVGKLYKLN